jgi:riboflavin synthase
VGDPVNLERAMRLDQRLGGHLVQGHIDGVGRVVSVRTEGEGRRIAFEMPRSLAPYVAEKGSIAIDGVSLTVAACEGARCEVAYIPYTLQSTVAGRYVEGADVHVEVDVVARYVARALHAGLATDRHVAGEES